MFPHFSFSFQTDTKRPRSWVPMAIYLSYIPIVFSFVINIGIFVVVGNHQTAKYLPNEQDHIHCHKEGVQVSRKYFMHILFYVYILYKTDLSPYIWFLTVTQNNVYTSPNAYLVLFCLHSLNVNGEFSQGCVSISIFLRLTMCFDTL